MGRQLNMLEIKSANIGRAEGSQVKVPVVLVCLADISYCHSSGIMEASFVGSCLTEFNNKAIFGYKLCHSFLTQQLTPSTTCTLSPRVPRAVMGTAHTSQMLFRHLAISSLGTSGEVFTYPNGDPVLLHG